MPAFQNGIIKYFSSYIADIKVESTTGQFSNDLEVVLSAGKYMLNSTNATYSYEDRYSSYKTALHTLKDDLSRVKTVLVLGLGLGSIPQMLQKIYRLQVMIDCVEIDDVIIKLAEKYYPPTLKFSHLQIHHADAETWIKMNNKKFDLITVDLFIDKNVPPQFHTEDFLFNLNRSLSESGILLFSTLKENFQSEKLLHQNLKKIFLGGNEIDTGGNLIYSFKSGLR